MVVVAYGTDFTMTIHQALERVRGVYRDRNQRERLLHDVMASLGGLHCSATLGHFHSLTHSLTHSLLSLTH